jgi:hypothetical protein
VTSWRATRSPRRSSTTTCITPTST